MATTINQGLCATCNKAKATSKCIECSREFCFNHFVEHRQLLSKQMDQIEQDRDSFQQTIDSQQQLLIEQVNRWEQESMNRIKITAEEARQLLAVHNNHKIEKTKLEELTQQLKESREQDDITEINLQRWKEELRQLTDEINKSQNIVIQQSEIALVKKLQIQFSAPAPIPMISSKATWIQNGIIMAGGNGQGAGMNQLSTPLGIYVDDDQNIYVADYTNHRIVKWMKNATMGEVVAGGQGAGNGTNQFNSPRDVILDKKSNCLIISDTSNKRVFRWSLEKGAVGETIISDISCQGLAMDNDGYLYVSDVVKHEVRRWKIGEKNGTLVAGGNGSGNRFDQLNNPYYICVDHNQTVYVSDNGNHRVVKWMKGATEGVVVAGGHGPGNALKQLYHPCGIVVDHLDSVYVADNFNHRVMRWLEGATEGSVVVGGNEPGAQTNRLSHPSKLSFDRHNNLYVAEYGNHRVQKFDIE